MLAKVYNFISEIEMIEENNCLIIQLSRERKEEKELKIPRAAATYPLQGDFWPDSLSNKTSIFCISSNSAIAHLSLSQSHPATLLMTLEDLGRERQLFSLLPF